MIPSRFHHAAARFRAVLTDVLQRIVSQQTKAHELNTLLPWNWTPSASETIASQPA
jgi:hypothetical protein